MGQGKRVGRRGGEEEGSKRKVEVVEKSSKIIKKGCDERTRA